MSQFTTCVIGTVATAAIGEVVWVYSIRLMGPARSTFLDVSMGALIILPVCWIASRTEGAARGSMTAWAITIALLSGVLGGLSFLFKGWAYDKGSMTTVLPIVATATPAVAVLAGWFCLGETVTLIKGLGIVLAFIGSYLILR